MKKLKLKDNLDLPVPRLEIRYRLARAKEQDWGPDTVIADYRLIYQHLLGHLVAITLGKTKCGGKREPLDLPFREGSHIVSDMLELGLPGYVINGPLSKAIPMDKGNFPGAVQTKIKKKLG